jgi:hypothetical protein
MNLDHGKVSIELEGNIIIVHLLGEFNEFGAKNYTDSVKDVVAGLNGAAFSILVNLLDLIGGTPEAFKEVDDLNVWLTQQNLIAKARVSNSAATVSMVQTLANSSSNQTVGDFVTHQEALKWLKTF